LATVNALTCPRRSFEDRDRRLAQCPDLGGRPERGDDALREDSAVFLQRALASVGLVREVLSDELVERARAEPINAGSHLLETLPERPLRVVLSPRAVERPLLFTGHLERVAVGDLLDLPGSAFPDAFDHVSHTASLRSVLLRA
jgi:hypothetical protein